MRSRLSASPDSLIKQDEATSNLRNYRELQLRSLRLRQGKYAWDTELFGGQRTEVPNDDLSCPATFPGSASGPRYRSLPVLGDSLSW